MRVKGELSDEELEAIRKRPENLKKFHSLLLAQADREKLLGHIDHLLEELARLRRSI
jgi:hypothetical protein